MDEHRSLEVTRREHTGDMRYVEANLVAAFSVVGVVGRYFDCAAVGVEPEMMRRLVVRKSHCVISALLNPLVMILLGRDGGNCQQQSCD